MPTLALTGTFSYYKSAKVPPEFQKLLKNRTAIEVIIEILRHKFELTGSMNRMYFIRGRTGSGKSTLMISELYEHLVVGSRRSIHITEPRVVLDESNANDILRYHPEWEMGVQMAISNGNKKTDDTNLSSEHMCFCTPGTIINQLKRVLQNEERAAALRELSTYRIIVVDEVHVLDLSTLNLMKVIYDIIQRFGNEADCPMFIFASATIDVQRMIEYYFRDNVDEAISNPLMVAEVAGSSNFPVEEKFLENSVMSEYNDAEQQSKDRYIGFIILAKYLETKVIPKLWDSKSYITYDDEQIQCRDVLVFIAAKAAIPKISSYLMSVGFKFPIMYIAETTTADDLITWRESYRKQRRLLIIGYCRDWSNVSEELLSHPIEQDPEARQYETHIIISTPIIETGKTITTLYTCIDTGIINGSFYIPLTYNFNTDFPIRQFPVNKNQAIQRVGRVGREAPGKFIHFYSKDIMDKFEEYDVPETVNNYSLSSLLLNHMKMYPEYNVYDTFSVNNYIHPISVDIMIRSNRDLIRAGFMTMYGEYINLKSRIDVDEIWMLYSEYLYYIKKLSLFHSLVCAAMCKNKLPTIENVSEINAKMVLDHVLEVLNDEHAPSQDYISGIKLARNKLTEIKHHHMSLAVYNRTFTYHRNLLFSDIPSHLLDREFGSRDRNPRPQK